MGSSTVEHWGRDLVARTATREADRHDDDIADGIANDPPPPYERDCPADAYIAPPRYRGRGLLQRLGGAGGIGAARTSLNDIARSIDNAVTASRQAVRRLVERIPMLEDRTSRGAMPQSVAMGSNALGASPGPIHDGMNSTVGRSPIVAREMNDSRSSPSRNDMASGSADATRGRRIEDRSREDERSRSRAR